MIKALKYLLTTFIILIGVTLLASCNKKGDFVFDVNSKSEKNIVVTFKDVKKNESKDSSIVISKAESLMIKSNLSGESGVHIKLYKQGSKGELITEDEIYFESETKIEGIEAGNYDIYFIALDNKLNGTIEVIVE